MLHCHTLQSCYRRTLTQILQPGHHHTRKPLTLRKPSVSSQHRQSQPVAMIQLASLLRLPQTLFHREHASHAHPNSTPAGPPDTYELSAIFVTRSLPSTDGSSRSSLCSTASERSSSFNSMRINSNLHSRSAHLPPLQVQTSYSQYSSGRTSSLTSFSELRGWSRGMFR